MNVSFVIVTRGRKTFLLDCLRSIDTLQVYSNNTGSAKQTISDIEVIVVDNSDDPQTADALAAAATSFQHTTIRYLRIPYSETVLAEGRNLGVRLSSAPLVAFVDDDTVLDAGWLSACLDTFQDAGIAAATGTIREPDTSHLDPSEPKPIGIIRRDGKMVDNFYLSPEKPVPVEHLRGCNWVCRKEVFQRFGGFHCAFRHVFEEADLSLRLSRAGCRLVFNPKMSLDHRCAPREHMLRQRRPELYFPQKRSNLKFYTFLLLKNYGVSSSVVWRYLLCTETGLYYLARERSASAFKEVLYSAWGKVEGICYFLKHCIFPRKRKELATPEVTTFTASTERVTP